MKQDELEARAAIIREQLANPESLKALIINELKKMRKSLVMTAVRQLCAVPKHLAINEQDMLPADPVTVGVV